MCLCSLCSLLLIHLSPLSPLCLLSCLLPLLAFFPCSLHICLPFLLPLTYLIVCGNLNSSISCVTLNMAMCDHVWLLCLCPVCMPTHQWQHGLPICVTCPPCINSSLMCDALPPRLYLPDMSSKQTTCGQWLVAAAAVACGLAGGWPGNPSIMAGMKKPSFSPKRNSTCSSSPKRENSQKNKTFVEWNKKKRQFASVGRNGWVLEPWVEQTDR